MIVERLTYRQAVVRVDEASDKVDQLTYELMRAQRALRTATAEMHHALHERLQEELP